MKTNKNEFKHMVDTATPKSNIFSSCAKAFVVGGLICVLGQALHGLYENWGATKDLAGAYTAMSLIFLSVLLTGMGIFDKIVDFAGAGATVPITGFANAMAAPAIEFKKEGYVFGVGAKMFIIAGPVIVFGTLASMVVGLIYFLVERVI